MGTTNMRIRERSHQVEDISRGAFVQALSEINWVANELWRDYGEDFFVRIFENEAPTPITFFAQLKATDNLHKLRIREGSQISFQISMRHLRTWHVMTEPVFLFIYDVRTGRFYWQGVDQVIDEMSGILEKNTKSVQVHIPIRNVLDADGFVCIQESAARKHSRLNREIVGSKRLISLFEKETGLRLVYNAVSGVMSVGRPGGSIELHLFGEMEEFFTKLAKEEDKDPNTYFATWIWEICSISEPNPLGSLDEWLAQQNLRRDGHRSEM